MKKRNQRLSQWGDHRVPLDVEATSRGLAWVGYAQELQAFYLQSAFDQWRKKYHSAPDEANAAFHETADWIKANPLIDRMEDVDIARCVNALTVNFYRSIEPEARALGVPPEGLLWAAMMHVRVTEKNYTFGGMLRVILRAHEVWKEHHSIAFANEGELEAFLFKFLHTRVRQLAPAGWDDPLPDDLIVEYQILLDFCQYMALVEGLSPFGKAMGAGLPNMPVRCDSDEFRRRAFDALTRFDKMEFEALLPF
ncbi:hypothetical protein [Sinorhizobium sp. CCBAU 05631]|uniref:hypothetical protein n=1 Tax=Sinorhizobium sp. CCBAU 05631 TaxID=794846 RepID=UPI0005676F2C|nr:hypothetical protein [Sinorhizobium sp. CCBAU 05631]ASY58280.1 hypothetical protein SS05631_c33660 [Sinorhizobium sp. CCBAU 05631]